jgi:hypothetical protein
MINKKDWQLAALNQCTHNVEAIAEAHIDAGVYGHGWLKVDTFGNLRRIDPTQVVIHVNPEQEND